MIYKLIIYQCERQSNKLLSRNSFLRDTAEEILKIINELSETSKVLKWSFIRFEIKEVK